jgi:hypothetical protein
MGMLVFELPSVQCLREEMRRDSTTLVIAFAVIAVGILLLLFTASG